MEKSYTLLDMIDEPMVVEIITPERYRDKLPEKTWVEVIDAEDSIEFTAIQLEYIQHADTDGNVTMNNIKEQLELVAKLAACLIVGWDETYFGEFNQERLMKVLTTPRFSFIGTAVQEFREERQSFFTKA